LKLAGLGSGAKRWHKEVRLGRSVPDRMCSESAPDMLVTRTVEKRFL
jgi:hypothetical protein